MIDNVCCSRPHCHSPVRASTGIDLVSYQCQGHRVCMHVLATPSLKMRQNILIYRVNNLHDKNKQQWDNKGKGSRQMGCKIWPNACLNSTNLSWDCTLLHSKIWRCHQCSAYFRSSSSFHQQRTSYRPTSWRFGSCVDFRNGSFSSLRSRLQATKLSKGAGERDSCFRINFCHLKQ